jgi:hypothetical protein
LAAFLCDDRHYGREVNIEAKHPQQFAGYFSQGAHARKIAMLAECAGRWHWRKDVSQTIDQATLLIDAAQWRRRQHCATVVQQLAHLLRRFDIAAKENDAARFDLVQQFARLLIDGCSGKADKEKLPYLLFEG